MPAAFLGIGTNLEAMAELHRSFRLLPSERVLWHGAKERGVARDRLWVWAPILACVFSAVTGTFAALIAITEAGPWQSSALLSAWGVVFAIGSSLAPHYLMDQNLYAVTDRRVLVKNAWTVRSIDRAALSFARITWHRSALGVGHLELVRAVPFGPLSRSQRLMLHDLRAPDAVLSVIRHGEAAPLDEGCDRELPLTDRLDSGERVLWGGGPEGSMIGWRELATAAIGIGVALLSLAYAHLAFGILGDLEEIGLPIVSLPWALLFFGTLLTFGLLLGVGGFLVWHGTVHARAEGAATEYLVTDRRVLIRRGLTELSLDRARIVDVVARPGARGLSHAFFILDGPEGRALADGGALGTLLPSRVTVPPIFWELRDVRALRDVLFGDEAGDEAEISGETGEVEIDPGRVSDAA
jgi:hypothetical protein